MSSRTIDPDIIRALATNAVEAERSEREQVYADERGGHPTYYCHGVGWPVVLLRSVADYDQRVRLSRAARVKN